MGCGSSGPIMLGLRWRFILGLRVGFVAGVLVTGVAEPDEGAALLIPNFDCVRGERRIVGVMGDVGREVSIAAGFGFGVADLVRLTFLMFLVRTFSSSSEDG